MMAGSVITVTPGLIVFLFLQRAYVRGVMVGGVKG
jgi:ABC-type glycerol-3-phosphate transport system permease component